MSNSVYHPSLHTDIYHAKIYDLLKDATSREDVIAFLRDIAEPLADGTF